MFDAMVVNMESFGLNDHSGGYERRSQAAEQSVAMQARVEPTFTFDFTFDLL